jgi:hypothetical protein
MRAGHKQKGRRRGWEVLMQSVLVGPCAGYGPGRWPVAILGRGGPDDGFVHQRRVPHPPFLRRFLTKTLQGIETGGTSGSSQRGNLWSASTLEKADVGLLRERIRTFVQALMASPRPPGCFAHAREGPPNRAESCSSPTGDGCCKPARMMAMTRVAFGGTEGPSRRRLGLGSGSARPA